MWAAKKTDGQNNIYHQQKNHPGPGLTGSSGFCVISSSNS